MVLGGRPPGRVGRRRIHRSNTPRFVGGCSSFSPLRSIALCRHLVIVVPLLALRPVPPLAVVVQRQVRLLRAAVRTGPDARATAVPSAHRAHVQQRRDPPAHARPALVRLRHDLQAVQATVLTLADVGMTAATTLGAVPRVATLAGRRRAETAEVEAPAAARPGPEAVEQTEGGRAGLAVVERRVPVAPAHAPMRRRPRLVALVPVRRAAAPEAIGLRAVRRVGTVRLRSATPRAVRAQEALEGPHVRRVLPEPGVVHLGGLREAAPMIAPLAGSRRRPNGGRWRSRPPVARAPLLR